MVWVRRAAWLPVAGMALVTLLCLLGFVGGFADLFRQLWPVWMMAALGLTVGLAVLRQWGPMRASAGCTLVLALLAIDLSPPQPVDGPASLRIVTHNAWGRADAVNNALVYALEQDADILALQEAFPYIGDALDQVAAHYPYASICPYESARLYSRRPIVRSGCLSHQQVARSTQGQPSGWRNLPPSAWAEIEDENGEPVVVVSVHMTWPTPLSSQDEQRGELTWDLARFDRANLVLVGDFNAAFPSQALVRMEQDWQVERQTDRLASWPAPFPLVGIDHVLTGANWGAVRIERGPQTGSDHRPLLADLARRS